MTTINTLQIRCFNKHIQRSAIFFLSHTLPPCLSLSSCRLLRTLGCILVTGITHTYTSTHRYIYKQVHRWTKVWSSTISSRSFFFSTYSRWPLPTKEIVNPHVFLFFLIRKLSSLASEHSQWTCSLSLRKVEARTNGLPYVVHQSSLVISSCSISSFFHQQKQHGQPSKRRNWRENLSDSIYLSLELMIDIDMRQVRERASGTQETQLVSIPIWTSSTSEEEKNTNTTFPQRISTSRKIDGSFALNEITLIWLRSRAEKSKERTSEMVFLRLHLIFASSHRIGNLLRLPRSRVACVTCSDQRRVPPLRYSSNLSALWSMVSKRKSSCLSAGQTTTTGRRRRWRPCWAQQSNSTTLSTADASIVFARCCGNGFSRDVSRHRCKSISASRPEFISSASRWPWATNYES